MQRRKLALVFVAVATTSCLAVLYALREPSAPALVPTAGEGVSSAPIALAPVPNQAADAPSPPAVEADFASDVARYAAAQEQALRDSILRIGEGEDLSLDARLDRYREALKAARAAAPAAPILSNPSMLAEVFLRMQDVQRELAAMSPAERRGELAHIRRELGFDDGEIARMEQIDARRETRWENGLAYMRERERLMATFEGDALEAELDELRDEYFAHEAGTIEAEEDGGFHRFERPRIYGRN